MCNYKKNSRFAAFNIFLRIVQTFAVPCENIIQFLSSISFEYLISKRR